MSMTASCALGAVTFQPVAALERYEGDTGRLVLDVDHRACVDALRRACLRQMARHDARGPRAQSPA